MCLIRRSDDTIFIVSMALQEKDQSVKFAIMFLPEHELVLDKADIFKGSLEYSFTSNEGKPLSTLLCLHKLRSGM